MTHYPDNESSLPKAISYNLRRYNLDSSGQISLEEFSMAMSASLSVPDGEGTGGYSNSYTPPPNVLSLIL
jgi:hypothetical protein